MLKHIIFIGILFISGYLYMTERSITHGPGIVAPAEPAQQPAFGVGELVHDSFDINPLAEFTIEARALSKKRYTTDKLGELAPLDVVFGWGPMSDERNLNEVLFKQSERYFNWQMTNPPLPLHKMVQHTANIHLIPSSPDIEKKLWEIRKGHVVKIEGYLVEATSEEGHKFKSSMRRNDYGEKSSELLWVKDIQIQ